MLKELLTQKMTDSEIKEAIKLFKKLIATSGAITYEYANPIEENCYISSSDIIGVYFPNTSKLKHEKHRLYHICSLSKVGGCLGVVFALDDNAEISDKARAYFSPYYFHTLDELIYPQEMRNIRTKIENRIKDYNARIKTLKSIKRVSKKDGSNFADTLRNFEGVNLRCEWSFMSKCVCYIRVGYDLETLYRTEENQQKNPTPTPDEIAQLIADKISTLNGYKKEEENNLKNLEKTFLQFKKIVKQLKGFRASVSNWYDYKNELDHMTL